MIISLCPIRSETPLTVIRKGDDLTLNDTVVSLESYVAGQNPWIVDTPQQDGGTWHVKLILPHGSKPPHATLFPELIEVLEDGPVDLPEYDSLPEVDEDIA